MGSKDNDSSFEFEKQFCYENLQVWLDEAYNLFYSADVLYEFERLKTRHLFSSDKFVTGIFSNNLLNRAYFNHQSQRMIWAYGFENVLKYIILAQYKLEKTLPDELEENEVPFKIIKSHNMQKLARDANITLNKTEYYLFGVLEKCSVWAGRYPLTAKENQMYETSKKHPNSIMSIGPLPGQIELEKKEDSLRVMTERDLLHTSISDTEYKVYANLKEKFFTEVKKYNY